MLHGKAGRGCKAENDAKRELGIWQRDGLCASVCGTPAAGGGCCALAAGASCKLMHQRSRSTALAALAVPAIRPGAPRQRDGPSAWLSAAVPVLQSKGGVGKRRGADERAPTVPAQRGWPCPPDPLCQAPATGTSPPCCPAPPWPSCRTGSRSRRTPCTAAAGARQAGLAVRHCLRRRGGDAATAPLLLQQPRVLPLATPHTRLDERTAQCWRRLPHALLHASKGQSHGGGHHGCLLPLWRRPLPHPLRCCAPWPLLAFYLCCLACLLVWLKVSAIELAPCDGTCHTDCRGPPHRVVGDQLVHLCLGSGLVVVARLGHRQRHLARIQRTLLDGHLQRGGVGG